MFKETLQVVFTVTALHLSARRRSRKSPSSLSLSRINKQPWFSTPFITFDSLIVVIASVIVTILLLFCRSLRRTEMHRSSTSSWPPPHTVPFSEVTLDEIGHQIWARGRLGEGLDHMWSEYEQIPASPFWEKSKKLLFYYKKRSRLSPQYRLGWDKISTFFKHIFSYYGA